METVRVQANGNKGVAEVTMLLYTGSDRSYISSALVRKINPEWVVGSPAKVRCDMYHVNGRSTRGNWVIAYHRDSCDLCTDVSARNSKETT